MHYVGIIEGRSISLVHGLMHLYETFPKVRDNGEFANRKIRHEMICESSDLISLALMLGNNRSADAMGKVSE